ncbi:MAG: hypothetical protein ACR2RD_08840 [Woeseiaceae bacterium]
MSEADDNIQGATPWHLWVIGVLGLLWSGVGAMDYVMTQTRNEAYMSAFSAEQLEFFYGLPTWTVAAWAIAVWGGVLGAILLLMRRRHAVGVFVASLLAMFVTSFQNYVLSNGLEVMGDPFSLVFSGIIVVVSIALVFYARAMYKQGVLI